MELQGRLAEIRKAGMGLAAISYDPVAVLADFSVRRGITFPLLSDSGSETIKRYGILNTTVDAQDPLYGIPFPGAFIVDRRASSRPASSRRRIRSGTPSRASSCRWARTSLWTQRRSPAPTSR